MPEQDRRKPPTVDALREQSANLIAYLLMKVTAKDWHAVADAAMDLREIDAKIEVLS